MFICECSMSVSVWSMNKNHIGDVDHGEQEYDISVCYSNLCDAL